MAGSAILLMVLLVGNCQSAQIAPQKLGSGQALKGYELYSWQVDGEWRYALALGTNRVKSCDEVTSSELAVEGIEPLKLMLEELPGGSQVFWSARRVPNMALPPDGIVNQVAETCKRLGLRLWVDRIPTSTPTISESAVLLRTPVRPRVDTPESVGSGFAGRDSAQGPGATSTAVAPASLLVHVMAEPTSVRPNGIITYTIILMNDQLDGEDPGTWVTLTNEVPSCTTYISGTVTEGARYDAAKGRIMWEGTVQRGLSIDLSFQLQAGGCALAGRGIDIAVLVRDALGQLTRRHAFVSVEEAAPAPPQPTATSANTPAKGGPVPHPSPTETPTAVGLGADPSPTPTSSPEKLPSDQPLIRYPSLNNIRSLAFAADGSLWAGTDSGVIQWDLSTDRYVHYGVAEGLASDDVTDLAFDPAGALWAGARGGVNRFDGVAWTRYTEADGLPSNLVYSVATGHDGSVWVGTQSGAAQFNGSGWSGAPADSPAADLVWHVATAADGDVWFSTHTNGVIRHSPAEGTWTSYGIEDGLPVSNARFLTIGPDGAPWLHVGYHHVYRFDGVAWQMTYEVGGGRWVCDIAFDVIGSPWIATCGGYRAYGAGLARSSGGAWAYVTTRDGLAENDVTAVAVGQDGTIAAGSDRGLSVYQAGSWRTLRTGPTMKQVTTVAVTENGAAWFGFGDAAYRSAGGGLSRFDGQSWQYSNPQEDSPLSGNVRALAVAPDGALWVGGGCGLARLVDAAGADVASREWQITATCDDLRGNVHAITFAPDHSAWIATDFSLYHLSDHGREAYENVVPTSLAVARDGTLWVAQSPLAGGGLSAYDGHAWITHTESLPIEPPITALAVTADDAVWVGARHGGLARFDGESWTTYDSADGLPSTGIVDLVVAPDDMLWAITDEGAAYTDGTRWTPTWVDQDLGGINAIAFAPGGSIWLATSGGAIHLQPQQGLR